MRFVFILCGIISGLMLSNVEEVSRNDTQILDDFLESKKRAAVWDGTCWTITADAQDQLKGCPSDIPLTNNGAIVAARIYQDAGNDIQSLSCNGNCNTYLAETRSTAPTGYSMPFCSVIINPGCTVYIFQGNKYEGAYKAFTGPALITNPRKEGFIHGCGSDSKPCVNSMLFTCKQVFPTCTPKDEWQVVTTLDNSDSSISSKFTYTKTVGTSFSQSITTSLGVSATVSAEISASFFDLFSAKVGVSVTTKFDWTKTDTETKSKATTYSVEVTIPSGIKIHIEEAVGTCGDSTVHTQMFRVKDDATNKIVKVHQGKMTNYKFGKKDFK